MWSTEIEPSQINAEPEELARAVVERDPNSMVGYLNFCSEHEAQGHELSNLAVCAFAAMPSG